MVEISPKIFQKFRKLLKSRNATHSTQTSRNSSSKVEWKESVRESFFENLGVPHEVVPFLEIFENTVPLAIGSCQKFKAKVLVEWKAPLFSRS